MLIPDLAFLLFSPSVSVINVERTAVGYLKIR